MSSLPTIQIHFQGVSPLLCHNGQTADPRNTYAKAVSYDDREQAKAAGFRWDPTTKQWSRRCSQSEIDGLPFAVVEA